MKLEDIANIRASVAQLRNLGTKQAFQPVPPMPAGDPSMGGGAPMDPAMAGGAPMDPAMAGGAPPMDPAAAGGAPPMDPAAGGAPPSGMPPELEQIMQAIPQLAQGMEELANQVQRLSEAQVQSDKLNAEMQGQIVVLTKALKSDPAPDMAPPEASPPPQVLEAPGGM